MELVNLVQKRTEPSVKATQPQSMVIIGHLECKYSEITTDLAKDSSILSVAV